MKPEELSALFEQQNLLPKVVDKAIDAVYSSGASSLTIAELLDKPHGRDALVYVLIAMDERWPKLSDGVRRPAEFWLLAGTAVRVLQNVEWLASAIIHVAKLHGANVGDEDTFDAHINVWHDSTLHPVTNRQIDQVVAWELDQEEPMLHSMDAARKVLLTLLQMDAGKRDYDVVYDVLRGRPCASS